MKRLALSAAWVVAFAVLAGSSIADGEKQHRHSGVGASKGQDRAFGRAFDPRKAKSTIRIEMSDAMRFSPAELEVRQGDTVRFVVRNAGRQTHELVLGTLEELKHHADLMGKHPGMEHDESWMVHVAPGKTGELGWQFTRSGTYYYGCLIPGHFEAGMFGKVVVKPGPLTDGEVRKVDKDAKRITLKHGPIENLEMPAMTMVFQVKDAAMLEQVKAGDQVKFRAEKVGGAFTVVRIERAK